MKRLPERDIVIPTVVHAQALPPCKGYDSDHHPDGILDPVGGGCLSLDS